MAAQEYAGSVSTLLPENVFISVCACTRVRTCVLKCVPHLAGNGFKSVKVQGL